MDAMKEYFEYEFRFVCGIPEIRLEGTVADYDDILVRLQRLTVLLPDLSWYLTRVSAIMHKVADSRRGNPNQDWWRQMITHQVKRWGCGGNPPIYNGWIGDFFAYSYGSSDRPQENNGANFADLMKRPVVTQTPVVLNNNGIKSNLTLAAGIIGAAAVYEFANTTVALRPAIGWMLFNGPN